jgi:hypothetical protein
MGHNKDMQLTEKQLDALRWMATNEGVPASGGANMSRRGSLHRIAASTLRSLEVRGLVRGYIGNDGARWYDLLDAGFAAGQEEYPNQVAAPKPRDPRYVIGRSKP